VPRARPGRDFGYNAGPLWHCCGDRVQSLRQPIGPEEEDRDGIEIRQKPISPSSTMDRSPALTSAKAFVEYCRAIAPVFTRQSHQVAADNWGKDHRVDALGRQRDALSRRFPERMVGLGMKTLSWPIPQRVAHYQSEADRLRRLAETEPVAAIREELLAVARQYQQLARGLRTGASFKAELDL
jgi:hypothetical protein